MRMKTREVRIGNVAIGGENPIRIQSMTNTKTEDVEATVAQILALEAAGCEIIRSTVPTLEAALAMKKIKEQIHIPLVADIHFDYRMAIAAMENGADKIPVISGKPGRFVRWWTARRREIFPSVWVSTAVLWRRKFWRRTAV